MLNQVTPMIKRFLIPSLFIPLLAVACATTSSKSRPEPPIVAIHNATGRDPASVTEREAPEDILQARRLGSVSPLLNNAVYTIRRRPNPVPLSDSIMVMWETRGGESLSATVTIGESLSKATGAPGEALVFHIVPGGQVLVTVELLKSQMNGGHQ
jgi:hypothetical protein